AHTEWRASACESCIMAPRDHYLLHDAGQWRDRAEEMRVVAEDLADPVNKRIALQIAADYDRLAERAEQRSRSPKNLADAIGWPRCRGAPLPSPAVLVAFLADALDRDHLLVVGGVEHDHALRRPAGDADAFDPGADQLAAVGHQHQLVLLLDR